MLKLTPPKIQQNINVLNKNCNFAGKYGKAGSEGQEDTL